MASELETHLRDYRNRPRSRCSLPDRFWWEPPRPSEPVPAGAPAAAGGARGAGENAVRRLCVELGGVSLDTPQAASEEEERAFWAKSVFLKDKKLKKLFMLTSPVTAEVSLKALAAALGAKELRLAGAEDMKAAFGFDRGCVTAMSVASDTTFAVTSVLDSRLLQEGTRIRMCTGCADAQDHSQHSISEQRPATLLRFLAACDHVPLVYNAESGRTEAAEPSCEGSTDAGGTISVSSTAPSSSSRSEALAWMQSQRSQVPDPVQRCAALCGRLSLQLEKLSHVPVVASEGQTSNQHHHEVLAGRAEGHIVVSLFLKGKKKKELCLVVRKPSTKPDMKALGARLSQVGLSDKEYRLADEESMLDALGVGKDFASPLALIDDVNGSVALVVFDTALDDGLPLWCLPPGRNDASWGLSLAACEAYAAGCGARAVRLPLE